MLSCWLFVIRNRPLNILVLETKQRSMVKMTGAQKLPQFWGKMYFEKTSKAKEQKTETQEKTAKISLDCFVRSRAGGYTCVGSV